MSLYSVYQSVDLDITMRNQTTEKIFKGSRHRRRPRFGMKASYKSMNNNPKLVIPQCQNHT